MRKRAGSEVLPPGRQAGVGLHLTSLPGRYGIGEIGNEAYAFIDSMQKMGLGVWQFLPLGPTAYGDSPYQPLSTFAGNEMLIDINDLLQKNLLKASEVSALTTLPADYVNYGDLIATKSALLKKAAGRFAAQASSRMKSDYGQFLEQNEVGWLHEYALFRILKSRHNERPWPEWSPEFVHCEDKALMKVEREAATELDHIKIQQFLFYDQWRRLREYAHESGVRLFGDMPICIALDSSDAWANRELLRLDEDGKPDHVAGVPPDYFSEDGQLWGTPLYDWAVHAKTGYRWWIERLQATTELADIVRIDHFRGFEAYWAVPFSAKTAKDGEWEPGPGDAIFDAMKSAMGTLPIVAEDLGVITPEVEALRDRHQIPGMVVLQFDVTGDDFKLDNVPKNCVCYTGTHDNDTTLGWFRGSPGDTRTADEIRADQAAVLRVTGGTADTVSMDLIKAAYSTSADLAIAPMQDYLGLGSEARINTPGKSSNNWRWRLGPSQLTDEVCDSVAAAVDASGRGNSHLRR